MPRGPRPGPTGQAGHCPAHTSSRPALLVPGPGASAHTLPLPVPPCASSHDLSFILQAANLVSLPTPETLGGGWVLSAYLIHT